MVKGSGSATLRGPGRRGGEKAAWEDDFRQGQEFCREWWVSKFKGARGRHGPSKENVDEVRPERWREAEHTSVEATDCRSVFVQCVAGSHNCEASGRLRSPEVC